MEGRGNFLQNGSVDVLEANEDLDLDDACFGVNSSGWEVERSAADELTRAELFIFKTQREQVALEGGCCFVVVVFGLLVNHLDCADQSNHKIFPLWPTS